MNKVNTISPSFAVWLDTIRFVAAALVLVCHVRGHFFLPYNELEHASQNPVNYFLFFITRLGNEAVIIFFVLSGYLVGGNVLRDVMEKRINWIVYFINRLTRMWVVLLPALLLGFILDYCSRIVDPEITSINTLPVLIGNMFFLQTIVVPTWGTNVALWSLAYEFWYYLIWPVFLLLVRLKNIFVIIISLVSVNAVLFLFMPEVLKLFPIWIIGALLRLISFKPIFLKRWLLFLIGALFMLSVGLANILSGLLGEYIVAVATSLLILQLQSQTFAVHVLYTKAVKFLANFSFSLYATHFFLMILAISLSKTYFHIPLRLNEASPVNWMLCALQVLIICFVSWVFYLLTEKHTSKIRKAVYKMFNVS